jgi:hypothetical protein
MKSNKMSKKPLMDDRELVGTLISKLDRLDDRLDSVDKTLVRQEANLQEHMRRTDLNEIAIDKIVKALEPVKGHVDMMKGAGKLLVITGTVVAVVGGVGRLLGLI